MWSQAAFTWEQEMPVASILTCFVDHRHQLPVRTQSRRVDLMNSFQDWLHRIRAAWHEQVEDALPTEFHIVRPMPPRLEPGIFAHVVLIQAPQDAWVSNLNTVFDTFISASESDFMRLVTTISEHVRLHGVLSYCGYHPRDRSVPFQAWIDGYPLHDEMIFGFRSHHSH